MKRDSSVTGNLKGAYAVTVFWPRTKLPYWFAKVKTKHQKMIINRKGTRMVKDGED